MQAILVQQTVTNRMAFHSMYASISFNYWGIYIYAYNILNF